MTVASLLLGTIISQTLFVITKILFWNILDLESLVILICLSAILIIIVIATVRRMGILNYFESIFLSIFWLVISLLVDLVITTYFTGREVYTNGYFWLSYLIITLAVFIFHKKVHVEARKSAQNK